MIRPGSVPTGRGGAYEKVDAKTAKPLPLPLQPVNKSEMLFLDYLNEWVQIHKASIQPATFISYNRMITGRITQYFEPLGLKLCEVTPQVPDEFQEKILLEATPLTRSFTTTPSSVKRSRMPSARIIWKPTRC